MNASVVHSDHAVVTGRLQQLEVTEVALREALLQGHLERMRLTPNHPRIYPGLVMWGWSVKSLRDQLRPLGWKALSTGNYELAAHDGLALAIAVASGDEATGNPYAHPSNRSRKGKNTFDAVEANRQLDLFDEELLPANKEEAAGHDTWVLLHFTDLSKKEIRIELSRPSDIGKDGRICAWSERILLGSISLDDDAIEVLPPGGPDIDIEIRRKVS